MKTTKKVEMYKNNNKVWILHKFLLALCFFCFYNYSLAASVTGTVVSVLDGDTVIVLDADNVQHRVRLLGIDAPEKRQAFGQVSKRHLSDLIFKQVVTFEFKKTDRNKRALGKVFLNGVDINLEQVKAGMAWWYEKYKKNQSSEDQLYYYYAQLSAAELKNGLWRDQHPIPPWEFRHSAK